MKDKIIVKNHYIADNLDDEQLAVVEAPLGNIAVFAGAGSGKTRALTYRIANLIDNGHPEEEMIALTFTKNASSQMENQIKSILNKQNLNLTSGTFHGVAARFIREYAHHIRYNKNFEVISYKIQREMIDKIRDNYISVYITDEDEKNDFPVSNVILEIYTKSIDHNIPFKTYMETQFPYNRNIDEFTRTHLNEIYKEYILKKRELNVMDYADLLLSFHDLLKIEEVRKDVNSKYKYVFVDEYQDINYWQFEILRYLTGDNNNIFVIGDSSQCIYQFRGASDKYIEEFEDHFPNASEYFITHNYRSSPEILAVAEDSINNNSYKHKVSLRTQNESNIKPIVSGYDDEKIQAKDIVDKVIKLKEQGVYNYSDMAILLRTRQEAFIIERELKSRGIPIKRVGGVDFLNTRHINDVLALVRFIADPSDYRSFFRVLSLLSGNVIGQESFKRIYTYSRGIDFKMSKFDMPLTGKTKESMDQLLSFYMQRKKLSSGEMIQKFMDDFYSNYMVRRRLSSQEKISDIEFLIKTANEYETYTEFLDGATLREFEKEENVLEDKISVYTIHKAKGLEWGVVFIPNINKDMFPNSTRMKYAVSRDKYNKKLDDERKLLYVAMTRAKEQLYLSYTFKYTGNTSDISMFLSEIDQSLLEVDED